MDRDLGAFSTIDGSEEAVTTNEFINNNKAKENTNSSSENVSSGTIATTIPVKHTAYHSSTARLARGSYPQNNDAVVNSTSENNNVPVSADQSYNSNTVLTTTRTSVHYRKSHHIVSNNTSSKNDDIATTNTRTKNSTASEKKYSKKVKHSTTPPPFYEGSTAAVSTKNSRRNIKKKNSIKTTTAKTHVAISNSGIEENDDAIDTVKLIRLGQNVLAKRKAKHHILKDTSATKPLVIIPKNADSTTKKKDDKKRLNISVGLGEQQAIRLSCDCVYPNDAYTTSSLVTDYIPSVYVKVQPSKKWFVQAEVKYKAPQYIQEQLYTKNISNQPLNYTTTTSVLKKVYYNQIPISFNYVIIPNLSIGIGVIYNNFAGKVSQHDVTKKLYGTSTDSTLSSSISTNKNDSNLTFTKNSFQGLIESEYQWKHFTVGARYAIGLQPYVKYKDPISGNPIEKTNNALTIFIRFELWDSKKKKKK